MLTDICAYLHNYFVQNKYFGEFKISGGTIAPLDFLQDGQYFRIVGSTFNDGIYQYPAYDLTDETFNGAVWAMAVPPAVIDLANQIKQENEKVNSSIASGGWDIFQSQSWGGFSGTVKDDISWQKKHSKELNKWRKI